ncbi:MAG: keto-hydroxyglutarate-aldolase/keto-deoxy-phosphogluconate aldolase, partial [Clostridia bacterium]|nr:keto-hydroxyglutarate-aldolase/keto-deoxy-phosphogluconate aldolase [Clostridia bacterium]
VNEGNLNNYLANPKVVCCGGSWIVPDKLVKEEKWEEITALCKTAVNKMLNFQLVHVGVNCDDEQQAIATAKQFETLFGWGTKVGNSSVFAGTQVECMKGNGRGTHGHIAVSTGNVKRAVWQLSNQGIAFDESSFKYDASGRMTVAYLRDEVLGFAIHLVEKK